MRSVWGSWRSTAPISWRAVVPPALLLRGPRGRSLDQIADILEGAIIKRRVLGREHGVALLAEGALIKRFGELVILTGRSAIEH